MNKRYTVLTYNIGNYELVREIEEKDPEAEYVLVADSKDVKSNTWNVVVDENISGSNAFDKVCDIRLNTFKYCNTDICIRVDASIKVKHSLKLLVDAFENGDYDIALSPHPTRNNILDEFDTWIKVRNYNTNQANKIISYLKDNGYDFGYKGLFQCGFVIMKNTPLTKSINEDTYKLVQQLGENGHMERIDQIPFTYILNTKYNDIKVLPLSEQILHSYYMQIYEHGTEDVDPYVYFDLSRKEEKYIFNEIKECLVLETPEYAYKQREQELLKYIERIQVEKRDLSLAIEAIRNSNSFKLGQKILYLPGLIKNKKK